jgi:GNAT superfamily N-acetyltransferase
MSDLEIRSLAPDDYADWRILWDEYNAFYGRTGATALAEDIVQTTWRRFFDDREPVHALVAAAEGRVVGLAHYVFHRSTILREPTCYLQDLFTAQTLRGRGVGRALITHVCANAAAAGCARAYWHTHETNATAMRLYDTMAQKSGFIVYRCPLPLAETST